MLISFTSSSRTRRRATKHRPLTKGRTADRALRPDGTPELRHLGRRGRRGLRIRVAGVCDQPGLRRRDRGCELSRAARRRIATPRWRSCGEQGVGRWLRAALRISRDRDLRGAERRRASDRARGWSLDDDSRGDSRCDLDATAGARSRAGSAAR